MYMKDDGNDFETRLKNNPFNLWYLAGRGTIFYVDDFHLCEDDYIKTQIEEYKTMSSKDYLTIRRSYIKLATS